jgi:hypothetical protein
MLAKAEVLHTMAKARSRVGKKVRLIMQFFPFQ